MSKLIWGPFDLSLSVANEHFMVVGATGSGKTTLLDMLLKSVFSPESFGTQKRALIYDPKQEMVPIFNGMGLSDRVKILHPFDARGAAWNMADDIDSPVSARQIATILIPEASGKDGDSFFINAVRDILSGVILTFIKCLPNQKSWTFRDVILTMLYLPYLKKILSINTDREGKPFIVGTRLTEFYLNGDQRTVSNILATISAKLAIYEPIAAVWHNATDSFSLREWAAKDCSDILILGNDEAARAAIDAINAAIFKRASEIILSGHQFQSREGIPVREWDSQDKEKNINSTWFFLDEIREAGKLDGLSRLLTKGRSKGACIVLGFQDIEGLRNVYGDEVANELTGQCNILALLQINNPVTAQWGADLFGSFMLQKVSFSHTGNNEDKGSNIGTTFQNQEQKLIQTGDLIFLPKTSPQNGLSGYFRHPKMDSAKGFKFQLSWNTDIVPYRPARSGAAFVERSVEEQYLSPWSQADWGRLGFKDELPDVFEKGTAEPQKPSPASSQIKEEAERATRLYEAFMGILQRLVMPTAPRATKKGDSSKYDTE